MASSPTTGACAVGVIVCERLACAAVTSLHTHTHTGTLGLARALGDAVFQPMVTCVPDVVIAPLNNQPAVLVRCVQCACAMP
jgi:hypothetical protein